MQKDKILSLWNTNVTLICHKVPGTDRQLYIVISE